MKIGILTQPLINNYGCFLQNYALQTVLKQHGYEVWTINMTLHIGIIQRIGSILKRLFKRYVLHKEISLRDWPYASEESAICMNFHKFRDNNIHVTRKIITNKDLTQLKTQHFSAYIVGSDQVWRPSSILSVTNYFLDFLDGDSSVKKLAYAASFGIDRWCFSNRQTQKLSNLIKQFDAISVREDSGIKLCKEHLKVEASHVLDPSMLLDKEEYMNLICRENIPEKRDILFTYFLDNTIEKENMAKDISEQMSLNIVSVPLVQFPIKKIKNPSKYVYPSIAEWLAGFRDADLVMTDSFHGAVFSIIFNKPFLVFANSSRGNSRFDSLLRMFHLEDRLITTNKINNNPMQLDYTEVNKILNDKRKQSMIYLLTGLNKLV